jgi:hypothetical protein
MRARPLRYRDNNYYLQPHSNFEVCREPALPEGMSAHPPFSSIASNATGEYAVLCDELWRVCMVSISYVNSYVYLSICS